METETIGDAADLHVIVTEGGVGHGTGKEAGHVTVTGGGAGHVIESTGGERAGQGRERGGGKL